MKSVSIGSWMSFCVVSAVLGGCGKGNLGSAVAPDAPTYAEAQGEQTPERDEKGQCFLPSRYADVLVVDMDPADRTDLESALDGGVLAVKYDCDGLEVVRDCTGPGSYGFSSVSLKEQVVQLTSSDELRANLPISGGAIAAEFGSSMKSGKSLDVGLVLVGKMRSVRATLGKGDLQGECEGATHFIRGVTVGAFAMQAGTAGQVASNAELFNFAAGAESKSSAFRAQKDGDRAACQKAKRTDDSPPEACRAFLRLELKQLVEGKTDPGAVAIDLQDCPEGTVGQGGKCVVAEAPKAPECSESDLETCKTQCTAGQVSSCGVVAQQLIQAGDIAGAVPFLGPTCQAGSLPACHNLGFASYLGAGVPQDFDKARVLFTQVCDGGEAVGCSGLGMLYEEGKGFTKDEARAADFYRQACNGGEVNYGCPFLGRLYQEGRGVTADAARARELYKHSCEAGGQNGCTLLKRMP